MGSIKPRSQKRREALHILDLKSYHLSIHIDILPRLPALPCTHKATVYKQVGSEAKSN